MKKEAPTAPSWDCSGHVVALDESYLVMGVAAFWHFARKEKTEEEDGKEGKFTVDIIYGASQESEVAPAEFAYRNRRAATLNLCHDSGFREDAPPNPGNKFREELGSSDLCRRKERVGDGDTKH